MTPERWLKIKVIFESVVDLDPDARTPILDRECEGEPGLRSEVEALLLSHDQSDAFLEQGPSEIPGGLLEEDFAPAAVGRKIGAYRLIQEIGRGGMGAVYLGVRDDDQYQKQVAIKLVRSGMDSDFVVHRFRTERQILANLDHPNIARLLDGGAAEDGLPYFVMEYIEGQPIDQYCDAHQLSIAERLKLFRDVCSAVSYAHQNLVVHRDIKPGNILVTEGGVAKLLDFGIAKLLDPALNAEDTGTAMALMTPEFASPEQIRGEPITTASDIYSLGVVLYVLLAGKRPYSIKSRAPEDIKRVVCELEPPRPSAAATGAVEERTAKVAQVTAGMDHPDDTRVQAPVEHQPAKVQVQEPRKTRLRGLAGDLDTIVMMAMRKEPGRRYSSVDQFSDDIRRYLEGLPVLARKDTFRYRAGKFVTRHKIGVAAAALIVAILIVGLIAVSWEARIANEQSKIAEQRFEDVRNLADSYMFEFNDAIKDLPGATPARELVVKRALEYLDKLSGESADKPALLRDLATAYQRVGDIQGRPGFPNLGDKAGALASYKKSLVIREMLLTRDSTNNAIKGELATSCERLGDVLRMTGDTAGALDKYRESMALREELLKSNPGTQARADLASVYDRLGDILARKGNLSEGLADQQKALALRETLSAADPSNPELSRSLMISYIKVGDMLMSSGKSTDALDSYRKAEPIGRGLSERNQNNSRFLRELTICYDKVGNGLAATHDPADALEYYRKSLAIREDLSIQDKQNAEARRDLSVSYDKIGTMLADQNKMAEALTWYKKALDNDQSLWEADKTNAQAHDDLSISLVEYANMQLKSGDASGALTNYQKAAAIREKLSSADPSDASVRNELAEAYSKIGDAFAIMAGNEKSPKGRRIESWNQARDAYQKGRDVLQAMRSAGMLKDEDAKGISEIEKEIDRCNSALSKLQQT